MKNNSPSGFSIYEYGNKFFSSKAPSVGYFAHMDPRVGYFAHMDLK